MPGLKSGLPTTLGQTAIDALPDNRRRSKLTNSEAFAMINSRASTGEQGRDPVHLILEKLWYTNIAHMAGLQHINVDNLLESLSSNFLKDFDNYVANHIFRVVMGSVSRLSRANPDWSVIPDTPDQEDQIGAKVGNHFLDHYHDRFHMRQVRRELGFWLATCGNGFISAEWNPRAGQKTGIYRNPFDKESVMDASKLSDDEREFIQSMGAKEERVQGDIELDLLSPFQVVVPHVYAKMSEMPWLVTERVRSLDWIWDNYPKDAPHVRPDELYSGERGQYWRRLSSLVNRFGFTLPTQSGERQESVTVRTMWIPPSGRFPNGARVVATPSRLLENGPHPYHRDGLDIRFPLVHFVYTPLVGRFWGMSLVEHLIHPQREYNRARAQIANQRDFYSQPQWIWPRGSETGSPIRNEYGDIWEYDRSVGKPELVNPPAISQAHVQTGEQAIYDLQTISAQSEVSQAQVPTGVRSGVAIQALQEKDMDVLATTVEGLEEGMEQVGSLLLKLTAKYVKEPQAVQVYGEYRATDIQYFSGMDLHNNTRVRVRQGSMRPRSKSETTQLTFDLMQSGGLDPMNPKHARVIHKAIDIGGADKFFLVEDGHRRRAQIENTKFHKPELDPVSGRPEPFPEVMDRDDHAAHLEEHENFLITDAFENLPIMRKLAFEAHMAKHEKAISEMVQAQMLLSGMGGAGGGSEPNPRGEPSPPAKKNPTPGPDQRQSES